MSPRVNRKTLFIAVIAALILALVGGLVGYRLGARGRSSSGTSAVIAAGCIDFHDVAPHVGETGCVSGRVLRVYTSRGGNTFLDFCPDYRTCTFTSVIFSSDRGKFGNLQTLEGTTVELRGAITVYQGRAEIIIRDPDQIRQAQ